MTVPFVLATDLRKAHWLCRAWCSRWSDLCSRSTVSWQELLRTFDEPLCEVLCPGRRDQTQQQRGWVLSSSFTDSAIIS